MSLSVHDNRSRNRSRSPGRRESRDIRAPSPAAKPRKPSEKYYSDEESDSDSRSKTKHSKKYYDDDSDSDRRKKKKQSGRYRDKDSDSDERPRRKDAIRHREDVESDSGARSRRKSSKKHYESESSDSDDKPKKKSGRRQYDEYSESSSSDSGSDHHSSKRKVLKPKREEPKHRRTSSPDTHSTALTKVRKGEYVQSSKPQYERERREGRHPSYASMDDYEHTRPKDYTRSLSYSGNDGSAQERSGHTLPGQYKWEYDHPSESHNQDPRAPPEQTRHLSMSTSGNFNVSMGSGHQPYHTNQPISPTHSQPPYGYPPIMPRPENHRTHSGNYQYADPSPNFAYKPKHDDRKPSYTQSAHPQFIEAKPHNAHVIEAKPQNGATHGHELGQKLQRLSISGGGAAGALSLVAPNQNHSHSHGALPPGSPLLEAYHGTYQSISPMPSPLMLPSTEDDDLSDIEQLSPQSSSDNDRRRNVKKIKPKKRVSFYDPEPDALALAAALKHSKPDSGPIISVLPRLSNDHILELRTEYKKHIKVNGKGINIAVSLYNIPTIPSLLFHEIISSPTPRQAPKTGNADSKTHLRSTSK